MITVMTVVWVVLAIACAFSLIMVAIVSLDPVSKLQADLVESYRTRAPYKLPKIAHRVKRTESITVKGKIR